MPSEMTPIFRGACATFSLGLGMALVGCGGGGSGTPRPTATPNPNATGTPTPTATSNGSGPVTSKQLVFVSTRSGASEIYKANTDGTNAVQLTHFAGTKYQPIEKPSLSPDGQRIVFQYGNSNTTATTANPAINIEIALIYTDGTGLIDLTNDNTPAGRPDDFNPVFSTDNNFIFWTSTRAVGTVEKVPHIWRMSGAVGDEGNGQTNTPFIAEPSSSPSVNRNTLAYIATAQTSDPITIQPLSGGSLAGNANRIGGNIAGSSAFNLALSPDGARVAFSTSPSKPSPSMTAASSPATLNIFNVSAIGPSVAMPSAGASNGGSAWSRDSNTLYFDAAGGTNTNRQIFSVDSSSSFKGAPKQVTTDAQGTSTNFSPAFLPGG